MLIDVEAQRQTRRRRLGGAWHVKDVTGKLSSDRWYPSRRSAMLFGLCAHATPWCRLTVPRGTVQGQCSLIVREKRLTDRPRE